MSLGSPEVDLPSRIVSYGMWRRVTLVRADVSEEYIAPINKMEKSASWEQR
jgi:hypothetical protein